MSAIGTKRTYRVALHMSAFGGKADIGPGSASTLNRESVTAERLWHSTGDRSR
jgi:hypothetical protein